MKVLIWFPSNVKGGGPRLFVNLVSALSRIKEIEKLKIVLSAECKNNEYFEGLKKIDSVNIYYYPNSKITELKSEAEVIEGKISDLTKGISELEHEIAKINLPEILEKDTAFFRKIANPLVLLKLMSRYIKIVGDIKHRIGNKQDEINKLSVELNDILEKEKKLRFNEIKIKEEKIRGNPVDLYGEDCDVVYFFWPHFIEFQETTRPSVCTFQDVVILDFPENVGGSNAKNFFEDSQKWLTETTIIATSSNYIKSRLQDLFNLKSDSIIVVPHRGFVMEYFSIKGNADKIRGKYNLPKEYIVYPANLGFHKNHYNLLIAQSRFKYKEKYPLVLFGNFTEYIRQSPPDYPELLNCARLVSLINRLKLGQGRDFFSLGYVEDEDVFALIKNAKFLVMPSLAEGGGSYPVEEALRMGVPVACSDIPVMREHLAGRTARIKWFDPESTNSITEAMNEIIEHYDLYRESAIKGMNDPAQSWDEIAENYVKIFKMAIEKFYKRNN